MIAAKFASPLDLFAPPPRFDPAGPREQIVRLTEEDHARAIELEAQIEANLRDEINYTGLKAKYRFRSGFLGEFALMRYLTENGIEGVIHRIVTNGRSQPGEIVVPTLDGELLIDAKAATPPRSKYLMIPDEQWNAGKCNTGYVVAVWLKSYWEAGIEGAMLARDVGTLPIMTFPPQTIPTRAKLFTELPLWPADLLDLLLLAQKERTWKTSTSRSRATAT